MVSKILLVVAVVATTILSVSAVDAASGCSAFTTCSTCVHATIQCGWCSTPVVFQHQSNPTNIQCAGYDKSDPSLNNFTCNGIFSEENCERGYTCDQANMTCVLAAPGAGTNLAQCQSNCSTVGKTYLCDNATFTCKIAPAGQGTAFETCEASCQKPTETQLTHPTETQMTHSNANHSQSPHSNSPHSTQPTTTQTPLWKCNATAAKCEAAKPGEGEALIVCEATCKKSNHTPSDLLGLWRGFSISNEKFSADEYDFNFQAGGVVSFTHTVGTVLQGTVQNIGDQITMQFSNGITAACLYKQQLTQPTTFEMMFACSESSTAPASFAAAMAASSTGANRVLLLQRCVDPTICTFTMQAGPAPKAAAQRGLLMHAAHSANANKKAAVAPGNASQPCEAYGASCIVCLSHPGCGFCSQKVVYQNGQTGTQCSAFQHSGSAMPWVCDGTYSTDQCVPGWACNATSQKCVPTQPGDGIPSQRACEAGCKAKPGPPSQLLGNYRGIMIHQNYMAGVLQVDMTSGNITETLPDGTKMAGTIQHYAAYVFITLKNIGKIGCIWSANSNQFVQYVTFACGAPGGKLPKGFDSSMSGKNGASEVVLAKCLQGCSWQN